MTMLHERHPDDGRLAAFAGADQEALADAALVAHVAACERCGDLVAELRSLRVALAELPDVAPPRQLRLLPPVEPQRAPVPGGWAALLRRLTAPAMALAVVLILVGAVGSSGALLKSAATGGAGVPAGLDYGGMQELSGPSAAASAASGDRNGTPLPTATTAPPKVPTSDGSTGSANGGTAGQDTSGQGTPGQGTPTQGGGLPYGWFLGTGVVLLAAAVLVRARTARSEGGKAAR
jgi:hypothetical protein